nr:MAG TPA: hypothetical protein [Caudoviricetes sp.]
MPKLLSFDTIPNFQSTSVSQRRIYYTTFSRLFNMFFAKDDIVFFS